MPPRRRKASGLTEEDVARLRSQLADGRRPRVALSGPQFEAGASGSVVRIGDPATDGADFLTVRVKVNGVTDELAFAPAELSTGRARSAAGSRHGPAAGGWPAGPSHADPNGASDARRLRPTSSRATASRAAQPGPARHPPHRPATPARTGGRCHPVPAPRPTTQPSPPAAQPSPATRRRWRRSAAQGTGRSDGERDDQLVRRGLVGERQPGRPDDRQEQPGHRRAW